MKIDTSKVDPNDFDFIEVVNRLVLFSEPALDNIDLINKLISEDKTNFSRNYIKKYGLVPFFISLKEVYDKYATIITFEDNDNIGIIRYLIPSQIANLKNRVLPKKGMNGKVIKSIGKENKPVILPLTTDTNSAYKNAYNILVKDLLNDY